jgi:hypothetical protein
MYLCRGTLHVHWHQLLPDRRGGRPESSLSPPTWGGGPPPHFWLRGGWRHHASFSGYGRYYWDVAATWNGWFLTKPSEWEPQPLHFHWRSSSRALFPPPPSPVALVAWIMEREDDVVRVRRRLWIRHSTATPTLREISATPRRSNYGET